MSLLQSKTPGVSKILISETKIGHFTAKEAPLDPTETPYEIPIEDIPPGKLKELVSLVAERIHEALNIQQDFWKVVIDESSASLSIATMLAFFDFLSHEQIVTFQKMAEVTRAKLFITPRHTDDELGDLIKVAFVWSVEMKLLEASLTCALSDPSVPYSAIKIEEENLTVLKDLSEDINKAGVILVRRQLAREHIDQMEFGIMADAHPLETTDIITRLRRMGVKAGLIDTINFNSTTTPLPPFILYTSEAELKHADLAFLAHKSIMANNPFTSAMLYNRFYFMHLILQHKDAFVVPPTQFVRKEESLWAFLVANESKTYAVKEFVHRGGGQTTIKLKGKPNDSQRAALIRFEVDKYPFIVQEWMDHDPVKDYLRVITVGEQAFARRPNTTEETMEHAQQTANGFIREASIPNEVSEQGRRLNSVFGVHWNSSDFIRSSGNWYLIDSHFGGNTDTFSWSEMIGDEYVQAWIDLFRKLTGR